MLLLGAAQHGSSMLANALVPSGVKLTSPSNVRCGVSFTCMALICTHNSKDRLHAFCLPLDLERGRCHHHEQGNSIKGPHSMPLT